MWRMALSAAALLAFAAPALAEVLDAGETGFTVSHAIETQQELMVIHRTMTAHIDEWWNPAHSWSGEAKNLYMKAEVGGCFCERMPGGGGVEHLRIIHYQPGKEIRFDGALGPLVDMPVSGRMTWQIEPLDSGAFRIRFTYRVHGRQEGGFAGIAPAVDGVIAEQLDRLGARLAR